MNRYVVIDLETTGHASQKDDKIIEIGIVVIENQQIQSQYSTFLNPKRKIPSFISKLTGIYDSDVADAPYFEDVADEVYAMFKDSYLIAHNVPFDMGFLNDEFVACGREPLNCLKLDTVELSRILYPGAPGYKLSQIASYIGIEHEEPHRALADAYVTAQLFLGLYKKLASLPLQTISHLINIEKNLKSDLYFSLKTFEKIQMKADVQRDDMIVYRGLAFKNHLLNEEEKTEPIVDSYGTYLDDLYKEEGTLEKHMKRYEKRQGQREMSDTIYHAFQSKQHCVIEAETGTGKTLGYLLPAIYESLTTGSSILVSTYTTQLQAQILESEIPTLKSIIPYPFSVVLLKGKSHYLSLNKLEAELYDSALDNYDIALTKAMLLVWITETSSGDIDEIQLPTSGYYFYKKISAQAESNKNHEDATWSQYNYYQVARKRAEHANLIITNHALLCTDIIKDYQLLPPYEKVIIDEAHHIEKAVSHKFGLSIDYIQMQFTLNQIGMSEDRHWMNQTSFQSPELFKDFITKQWDHTFQDTKYEIDELFRYLFIYVTKHVKEKNSYGDTGRIQYRYNKEKEDQSKWTTIEDMTRRVIFKMKELIIMLRVLDSNIMKQTERDYPQILEQIKSHIGKLTTFNEQLTHLFLENSSGKNVKWIEVEAQGAKNAVYLYSEPVTIQKLFKERFLNQKETVIFTSATLTMKGSFSYIEDCLGLDHEQIITEKIKSPFSYKDQVQLLIPNDFPDINMNQSEDYIFATCEAILSLAEVTDGRMLVLFTSFDMLKKTYHLLRELMEGEQYMLIAQGISSGSRERLKKNFQSIEQSILLGTNSFWEGVDIPGDDLSCLVIARLPFQPPNHPIFEAKAHELESLGKNSFYDLSLPTAVIRFKQGFGRLIRSNTDRGIVFVCDSRIKKSTYGKNFIQSIPDVPIEYDSTRNLIEISRKWF